MKEGISETSWRHW